MQKCCLNQISMGKFLVYIYLFFCLFVFLIYLEDITCRSIIDNNELLFGSFPNSYFIYNCLKK